MDKKRTIKTLLKMIVILSMMFVGIVTCKQLTHADTAYVNPQTERAKELKTPWRNGNVNRSLKLDWVPMIRNLAAGKVQGDRYTWSINNSPLYIEKVGDAHSVIIEFARCLNVTIANTKTLMARAGDTPVGLYTLESLGFKMVTRTIEKAGGEKVTRCALAEMYVDRWCTPYGASCSRDQAVNYQKKCQKVIDMVVKKVIAAKDPNGQPLSKVQKLKYIHDWLITSVEYDHKGLNAKNTASPEESATKLCYLFNEYGALVDGRAVCQGYAYAFKAIVDELVRRTKIAIECDVARSDTHAWNRVKLNGKWYVIDVTWDDQGKKDFKAKKTRTKFFLVTDKTHEGITTYTANSGSKEKATDRKYEGKKWPKFKKSLKECTVSLKYPNKVYIYKGKTIIPEVVVRYGRNTLPKTAYKIVRTDKRKTGKASFKVVPSKKCKSLSGSKKGPSFKIKKQ